MAHKFNPENISRLDNPERIKSLPPDRLLLKFGLKKGDIFADLGAGSGYFTFPAAKIVGESGYVYALDISEKMLETVKKRFKESPDDYSNNFQAIKVPENIISLPDCHVDFILASMVLHESMDLSATIGEIYRTLKTGGKLAVIEWSHYISPSCGPAAHDRLNSSLLKDLLKNFNFDKINYSKIGRFYYSITAIKK